MRRALPLLLVLAALAGCGGSRPAGPASVLGKGAAVPYSSGDWAVVVKGDTAVVAHRVSGAWQADRSGAVKVEILGPSTTQPQAPTPQVAAQLVSTTPLVESALWIDGVEVLEKGGGSPTRGTIYGAPAAPLLPGKHLLVAYARTTSHGTAVARVFHVAAP